jgi:probable regulatory domain-containing protein
VSDEIPLNPVGRKDIHQLETILLAATLLRPQVLEMIRNSAERLTWVDSLAVAAGALARQKAGMTVTQIAEEMGRTEQTIRKHLKEESKAGQLVRETYETLKEKVKEGKVAEILPLVSPSQTEEVERLKKEREELKQALERLRGELEELLKRLG